MRAFFVWGALLLAPVAARADIIPTNTGVTGGPSNYTWNYRITVTEDQRADAGSAPGTSPVAATATGVGAFFTLYDFAGYIPGSCSAPSGWTCSSQTSGFTPDGTLPNDGSLPNLTFTYVQGPSIAGEAQLSGFSAQSTMSAATTAPFTARATRNVGAQAGTPIGNIGTVSVPAPTNGVPEPATLLLFGTALAGFGALRRRT